MARIVVAQVVGEGQALGGDGEVATDERDQVVVAGERHEQRLQAHLVAQTPQPGVHVVGVEAADAGAATRPAKHGQRIGQGLRGDLVAALHLLGAQHVEER